MSVRTLLKVMATMMVTFGSFLVTVAQAQEAKTECPHEARWKPPDDQPSLTLCNADLSGANLSHANLFGANLGGANLGGANLTGAASSFASLTDAFLGGANLTGADLGYANLTGASLGYANLSGASLFRAYLTGANLSHANLTGADLRADLTGADLEDANLSGADLRQADLTGANLGGANLTGANLNFANLNFANLSGANLSHANLFGANLTGANLNFADLEDARLARVNLTSALYAPASPPPDTFVASITGIDTVTFPQGEEIGLIQLRELLQKAGLRDWERQATYAIEKGKTSHAIAAWRVAFNKNDIKDLVKLTPKGAEGVFRFVVFDLTTAYGLRPSQALGILLGVWLLVIPFYWWTIWKRPTKSVGRAGIYRIWPRDRVEVSIDRVWPTDRVVCSPILAVTSRVERLYGIAWKALAWAMWFSLLSAFHVGFREFSVGTWLSRIHPRQFALEATGWVRTLSGLQSLLSLILLALFVLTYFGRPFQ